MEEVLEYLSENIKVEIIKALNKNIQGIEEIRLRTNKPIVIKNSEGNLVLSHIVTTEELLETFQKICEHSIY